MVNHSMIISISFENYFWVLSHHELCFMKQITHKLANIKRWLSNKNSTSIALILEPRYELGCFI